MIVMSWIGIYSAVIFTFIGLIIGTWYAWRITCYVVCEIILPWLRDWKSSLKVPVTETNTSLKGGFQPIQLMKIGPTFNSKGVWNWSMLGVWIVFYQAENKKKGGKQ